MEDFIMILILIVVVYYGYKFSNKKPQEIEINSISLDDYEKNLNKIFKYNKIKTTPLFSENHETTVENSENLSAGIEVEEGYVETSDVHQNLPIEH